MFKYFQLKDAIEEVKDSFSFGGGSEKLASAAKLIGKTAANVGMLAVEGGIEAVKRLPETTGSMARKNLEMSGDSISQEKKDQMCELVRKGDEARSKREAREAEDAQRKKEEEKRRK